MDTIFELLILALFLLFPLLQRGLQKRKQQQTGTPVPPLPHETDSGEQPQRDEEMELDEALQEIRDLLGMPESTPRPKPAPKPQQPVTVVRRPTPPPAPRPTPVDFEFHLPTPATFQEDQFESLPTEPFEAHDEHDQSEQRFEALAPYAEPFGDAKRKASDAKDDAAYDSKQESAKQRRRKRLLQHLRNTKSAREAVLLSEILGPPKSMRS